MGNYFYPFLSASLCGMPVMPDDFVIAILSRAWEEARGGQRQQQ
ncbi:MAG: hypothetical protein O2971_07635 [Proteobacteria bacterium]|nr:hypothetical protein [Pseudomonadota bacterium]